MRFIRLIFWDMKFQFKYGFYLLYAILTALYLTGLFAMPAAWRENAAAILIFSDPAAMGLFFMGAIVLLEKSQRLPCAFAVSPVRAIEYIAAKVVSLSVIALVVASILASAANVTHLPYTLSGTALASTIFTLTGIIIATKITSLNQFILLTVPVELLSFVPAILHLFKVTPAILRFYPANVCMDMVTGRRITAFGLFLVIAVIAGLFVTAYQCILKMWRNSGGARL